MIDWHCHLLPGLDDGAKNLDESIAMGRLLAEAGFVEIYCTPHCLHGAYDNTPEGVRQATAFLQQVFQKEHIPLELHPGMEYYLDEMFLRNLDNLQPLGDSRLILVEAPQQARPEILKDTLFQLLRRKWVPVMAHPERCSLLNHSRVRPQGFAATILRKLWPFNRQQSKPTEDSLLATLSNMGCRFQGNIPSFADWYGPEVAYQARAHFAAGIYEFFGSDGHDSRSLKRMLLRGLEKMSEMEGEKLAVQEEGI